MISYYFYKLFHTIASLKLAILLPRATWKNWIIRYTPKDFGFDNHVVLGFWDTKLFHLGDQLFHIGLIRSLQAAGVKVTICGNTPLQPFFKRMNVCFVNVKDLKSIRGALVISKDDMFFAHLKKNHKNAYLGINYRYTTSPKRIGEILIDEANTSLQKWDISLDTQKEYWNIESLVSEPEQLFDLPTNTILYNDFVASGATSAYHRLPFIQKLGETHAKKGYKITYVGDPKEKLQRPAPSFIAKDMRGETRVTDVFNLINHPHVEAIIAYDTLWAHVGFFGDKTVHVVNRQGKAKQLIWDRFIPMSEFVGGNIERY